MKPTKRRSSGVARASACFDEHTYAHRARQILELVGLNVPVGVRG